MGCTQSTIENEEAVTRCKDRKQFMKGAVAVRKAFAAAHYAYAMALKNTGAALSDYAHGDVQNPQQITNTSHSSAATVASGSSQPLFASLLPPPPPPSLEPFPAPIQRASTMPEMKIPKPREQINGMGSTIPEKDDDVEDEIESNEKLSTRKRSKGRNKSRDHQPGAAPVASPERPPSLAVENNESVQAVQEWEYWFPESIPGPSLEVKDEKENADRKGFDELPKRDEKVEEKQKVVPPSPPPEVADVDLETVVAASGGGSVGRNVKRGKSGAGAGKKGVAKRSLNMFQVFVELDDHFLKASESAHEVSKMLEATRFHYHSNFADNRGNCQVFIKY